MQLVKFYKTCFILSYAFVLVSAMYAIVCKCRCTESGGNKKRNLLG